MFASVDINNFTDPAVRNVLNNNPRFANDVVLTNVIGFDVKAWDPGAPIYQYHVPATGSQPDRYIAVAPGDPNYAVVAGMSTNSKNNVVAIGYGAYVDLGYLPDNPSNWKQWTNVPNFVLANQPRPPGAPAPRFNNVYGWNPGEIVSTNSTYGKAVVNRLALSRVYDTWSTHYDTSPVMRQWITKSTLPDPTNGFDDFNYYFAAPQGSIAAGAKGYLYGYGPDHQFESVFPPPYPCPLRAIQVKIRAFEPSSRQIREVTIEQDFVPR
jgi:hypothetical protein